MGGTSDYEAEWASLTLLEQEGAQPGAVVANRWGAFPSKAEPQRVMVYPDIHFPYQDVEFLKYLDAMCDEHNPTDIIGIGDLLDCYSQSSFDKDPARKKTFNDERIEARAWLQQRRNKNPQARMRFMDGNHEERLGRIKKQVGWHDVPELELPELLGCDKLGIEYYDKHGFIDWGIRFKHGESTAKWSSNAEMLRHRMSGVSGHVHRKQESEFTDAEGHHTIWRAIGHCCDMDQVEYVKGPNWQHGGARFTVMPDGEIQWEYLEG